MESEPPTTIESLPPELLTQIFACLASAPLSESRLNAQPAVDMFKSPDTPLKNISCVSRRWRAVVLPILFRNVIWAFDRWDLLVVEPGRDKDPVESLPFLRFLTQHDLARHVESLTMIISDIMKGITRRAELGRILDVAGSASNSSSSSGETPAAGDSSAAGGQDVKAQLMRHPSIIGRAAVYNDDNNWVWELLFGLMDPRRITMVTSPHMLASLLSRMLFLGDGWAFTHNPIHILSLSRDSKSKPAKAAAPAHDPAPQPNAASSNTVEEAGSSSSSPSGSPRRPVGKPCALFTIRPWTHLLLNEGSSTRVYRTYEFFQRRPPSILGALLGAEEQPNNKPLVPSTVTSMSYIAIFPLSTHFMTLVEHLPPVEKLYIQLVPRNDILRDRDEMRNVLSSDLWMERNTCYSTIMHRLLITELDNMGDTSDGSDDEPANPYGNWSHLRVFESGDAADRDAWDMAVEYMRASGTGWRVERDGVFVRGPDSTPVGESAALPAASESGDADGEATATEIFHGSLERIAFHGVENIPLPPWGSPRFDYDTNNTLAETMSPEWLYQDEFLHPEDQLMWDAVDMTPEYTYHSALMDLDHPNGGQHQDERYPTPGAEMHHIYGPEAWDTWFS